MNVRILAESEDAKARCAAGISLARPATNKKQSNDDKAIAAALAKIQAALTTI